MTGVRRGTGVRALLAPSASGAIAAAAVTAAVAVALEGPDVLGAVALGTALVLGFLLAGQLPVSRAVAGQGALGAILLALGYVLRVLLLLAAFYLVVQSGSPDREVLGATIMAVGAGWTIGTVVSLVRWKPPVVDVELPSTAQRDVPTDEASAQR
jgi:hypothetical protein